MADTSEDRKNELTQKTFARFLTEPLTPTKRPERSQGNYVEGMMDIQADWTTSDLARMQIWHRSIGDRIDLLPSEDDGEGGKGKGKEYVNPAHLFADRISMMTWGAKRKSKTEVVVAIRGIGKEKRPLFMEDLENVDFKMSEDAKKEKEKEGLL